MSLNLVLTLSGNSPVQTVRRVVRVVAPLPRSSWVGEELSVGGLLGQRHSSCVALRSPQNDTTHLLGPALPGTSRGRFEIASRSICCVAFSAKGRPSTSPSGCEHVLLLVNSLEIVGQSCSSYATMLLCVSGCTSRLAGSASLRWAQFVLRVAAVDVAAFDANIWAFLINIVVFFFIVNDQLVLRAPPRARLPSASLSESRLVVVTINQAGKLNKRNLTMVAFFGVTHIDERAVSKQLVKVYNTLPFDLGLTLWGIVADLFFLWGCDIVRWFHN